MGKYISVPVVGGVVVAAYLIAVITAFVPALAPGAIAARIAPASK